MKEKKRRNDPEKKGAGYTVSKELQSERVRGASDSPQVVNLLL